MTADTLKYNNLQTDFRVFVFCADTRRRTGYSSHRQTLIHFFTSLRQFYKLIFVQTPTQYIYNVDNWVKKCSDTLVFPPFWVDSFTRFDFNETKLRFKLETARLNQNVVWQRITAASQPARETAVPMQTWYTLWRASRIEIVARLRSLS